MDVKQIQKQLEVFAKERNWNQFHSPKNLAMALAGEVGELVEIFQWLTEEQSREVSNSHKDLKLIKEEIADVFIYLARLADKLGIDIEKEVERKIKVNKSKYPVKVSRNNATKYNRR